MDRQIKITGLDSDPDRAGSSPGLQPAPTRLETEDARDRADNLNKTLEVNPVPMGAKLTAIVGQSSKYE